MLAITTPVGEAGEAVELGDLVAVRAVCVHHPDLAQEVGTRIEGDLRPVGTPDRVAIVRLVVAQLALVAAVAIHGPDLVLVTRAAVALEGDALAVGAPDGPHVLGAIDRQLEQRRLAFFGESQPRADQAQPERQEQGPSRREPPLPRCHPLMLGSPTSHWSNA